MPRRKNPQFDVPPPGQPEENRSTSRPLCVLVVDSDQHSAAMLEKIAAQRPMTLLRATTAAEARRQLASQQVDLAIIDPHLPDASGMELMAQIRKSHAHAQLIITSRIESADEAIEAMRAGAADVLRKPLVREDLSRRLAAAVTRHEKDRQQRARLARLKRVCRKLNAAREEVTQQVDILCNDLVSAYQELASQVQGAVQVNEFTAMVSQELDLEQVLRRTLEYLLQKAGPTNAAVFLPSAGDEYALGGYVNYDCTRESADLILQHMADVLAPRIGQMAQPMQITDNNALEQWLGPDAAYLADSHLICLPCRHKDEPLAVIALFRDNGQPFDGSVMEICNAIGPLLGDYLARIIRIHHRHVSIFES